MDWQTPLAIAIAIAAAGYALRRWLRPLFADERHESGAGELLQIVDE